MRAPKAPSRDLCPMPTPTQCVCQTHILHFPGQHCTTRFWTAGVWVAKLGRKRGKRGPPCAESPPGQHACPHPMCSEPTHRPQHR